ncbi:MAG: DUF4070 domain-containing protein [Bacteroidales bacterium]|nr:DUF4070 domain-containing protein [Bacteroidales bacterium]
MKILLIHPRYPETFWSYKYALKFISKKAANPPLGLITVAALLPSEWEKKLTDLNVSKLKEEDIRWADYVFISAMSIQYQSVNDVMKQCKALGKKIVAGGPLFSADSKSFADIDHLVLNEAEITLPQFLKDLENGCLKRVYQTDEFAELAESPIPDYSLLELKKYATASIQFTRGCPFNCEFCDITALFGHKVRVKTTAQIIAELENLLENNWKGPVFFVDDNFIGNKKVLKNDLLPAITDWMTRHRYPFSFTTEASVNLADDPELMAMMVGAGFIKVFVGIETPEEESLAECNKVQNNNRNLIESVKTMQMAGLEVMAGFIVGFDHDPPNIFQRQIDFIQKSGIVSAMVGLLNAPRRTRLYKRLMEEGRIVEDWRGDNTNYSMNFIPKMNKEELMAGYRKIINGIYSSKAYYQRVMMFLRSFNPPLKASRKISFNEIIALTKSMLIIGILNKNRKYYWELLLWSLLKKPRLFPMAVTFSIYGYHYRKVFGEGS